MQDSTSSPDGPRRVRDTEDRLRRGRLSRGALLRLGLLLAAACACVHVYLEAERREASAAGPAGAPRGRAQQGRTRPDSAEAARQDRSVRRRVSYVQTGKRERSGDGGDSSQCCPHRKARWHITLEPWAAESRSLEDEAKRFLTYITTPHLLCSSLAGKEGPAQGGSKRAWDVCLDPKFSLTHRMESKHCRVYSFGRGRPCLGRMSSCSLIGLSHGGGCRRANIPISYRDICLYAAFNSYLQPFKLGIDDRSLERFLARSGCEVHCFNPSLKLPHLQQGEMWLHRLSIDWRDPNPGVAAQRQYATTKKLAAILNDFGHRQVDVLKADVESAEWKILENLILEGVLDSVGQLLLELHLHWPGFEVAGDEPSVVRYWFSLLKELERANFRLFRVYSDPGRPHLFLHKNVLNASSAYTLSWVKVDWTP